MKRTYGRLLLLSTCTYICLAGHAFAQSDTNETIKVETRLVSVPVIVSDRNGRYVPNLKAADFTVLHDGVEQKIDFFAATEEPLTIALLIDTSQSTRTVLDDIKDSARSFLKLLGANDRAMVATFDYDTHILSGLTGDQKQLERAVKNAEIPDRRFGTKMRDTVYETVASHFRGINGRKAIILLTDGKDAGSRVSADELLFRMEESDTLIYTVMFKTNFPFGNGGIFGGRRGGLGRIPMPNPRGNGRGQPNNEAAEEFLRELSETTAGRFFTSRDGKLKSTFVSIVDELRYQYRLGFYPPETGDAQAAHSIKVKVNRPDAVVRSRQEYRIAPK